MTDARGRVPWPIRAILFDKDGTLIDYRATWQAANRAAALDLAAAAGLDEGFADELLRRLGYEPSSGEFAADSPLLWATNAEIAARWSTAPELEGVDNVHARVERCFADQAAFPPVPVTELAPLFDRLVARGLRLGVATMDGSAAAEATLARLAVRDRIAFLAGADSGFGLKPEPGMVLGFCTALGLAPAEVLVVGDHPADLAMARAAGAGVAVAVLTGGCPPAALDGLADIVLPSIAELEAGLDGWSGWADRRAIRAAG